MTALSPEPFLRSRLPSPIGPMLLVSDGDGAVRALDWEDRAPRLERLLLLHYGPRVALRDAPAPASIATSLSAYFAGDLTALDGVSVVTAGTPFQRLVWRALRAIPVGTTLSYGALAAEIGRPAAVRAVGLANGSNPVSIIVACHRVIGADASLTGYGGGLERKRWLLAHEGVALAPERIIATSRFAAALPGRSEAGAIPPRRRPAAGRQSRG